MYAIQLPTTPEATRSYLSERGEADFPDYAARFETREQAERMLAYCEAGSIVVDHPAGFDDDE